MNISIFGIGYVGTTSLGCLARDGHHVLAVDVDPIKLDAIRRGEAPVVEPGLAELIRRVVASGHVVVTDDATAAVHESDVSFVCVGTPAQPSGGQDLTAIKRVSVRVGRALRSKRTYHLVAVRSTILPGTLEEIIQPIIEEHSGKQAGEHFDLCVQPEFLREGSSIHDYDNPPYTVVGTQSQRAADLVRALSGRLRCEFVVTAPRTAEALKHCCNVFHALKVTFANEVGRLGPALGVDPREVMDLLCRDTQLNISNAYLQPGFAFGGPCLPKDLRALLEVATSKHVTVPMLDGILRSNAHHIDRAVDLVLSTGKRTVAMIGLTVKRGTDDLRDSPLVILAERLVRAGLDLRIHDPHLQPARLTGSNRRFIEARIPDIATRLTDSCEELIAAAEVVVAGSTDQETLANLCRNVHERHVVLDLVGRLRPDALRGRYAGMCW